MKKLLICYLTFFILNTVILISVRGYWGRGLSDFSSCYAAGTVVRAGNGASLYQYATQAEAQLPFRPVPLLFTHPPFETALYAVMTFLSYKSAFLLWWAINHVLLFSFLVVTSRTFPNLSAILPFTTFCLAVFMPIQFAFVNGQTSILILLSLSLSLWGLQQGKYLSSGVLLSIAMIKPQIALPIFLIIAVRSSIRFSLGFLGGLIAEFLVSVSMVGVQGVFSYPRFLKFFGTLPDTVSGTRPLEMSNLRGLLFRLHLDSLPLLLGVSALAVVVAIVITRRSSVEVRFAVATIVGLIVSFHGLRHDQSLVLLPFLVSVDRLINRKIVGPRLVTTTLVTLGMIWTSALLLNPMVTLAEMVCFCCCMTLIDFTRSGTEPTMSVATGSEA